MKKIILVLSVLFVAVIATASTGSQKKRTNQKVKVAVIYDSKSGNTREMGEVIASGMREVNGIEVKTYSIDSIDYEWVKSTSCIVVGTPIRSANMTSDMKSWIEKEFKNCSPANKLGGAFSTAGYVHGGGTLAVRAILDNMMVQGMITYSSGASAGKPVIHLGPVAISSNLDEYKDIFKVYGKRMAQKTIELFGK